MDRRPRVIIIGAGFGGLHAAQTLQNKAVDVLLIDRENFHTFTPLLYQVATCGLEAEEIAYPVRGIFRGSSNITFMLGEVADIDRENKAIDVKTNGETRRESYDYLIVAAGSVTNYFNNHQFADFAFELKTLDDAIQVRNHVLRLFDRAAWTQDEDYRKALTTLVIVGGGPTGLETAGALRELYQHVLDTEHRNLPARILLVEATDRLLIPFPEQLQQSALQQLTEMGVEVVLGNPVAENHDDHVKLKNGEIIQTYTLIWSAGVKASPLSAMLGYAPEQLKPGGRVPITETLELPDDPSVYVVGDMAYLEDANGRPYPMMIPAAKQQGILAAKNILAKAANTAPAPFKFTDRGMMATIGRSRAVAYIFNRFKLSGFLAWIAWLGLHLLTLMGFRNRLNVLVNWVWNYITYDRSVRIILDHHHRHTPETKKPRNQLAQQ